ncbi:MAG: hypothetical protein ACI8S6_003090 [Myxococcota bacterium]|jgi:hypothetical protein
MATQPPTGGVDPSVDRLGSDNTGGTEGDASPRSDHQQPRQNSEGQENPRPLKSSSLWNV